jgi:hypothetical protein
VTGSGTASAPPPLPPSLRLPLSVSLLYTHSLPPPERHASAARRAALGRIVKCALQRSAHSVSAGEKGVPKRHDFHGPVEHERAHPARRSPRMRESCRPGSSQVISFIVSSG